MTMLDKSYDHRICTVHNPLYTAAEISVFCLIIFSPKLASDKFMKLTNYCTTSLLTQKLEKVACSNLEHCQIKKSKHYLILKMLIDYDNWSHNSVIRPASLFLKGSYSRVI